MGCVEKRLEGRRHEAEEPGDAHAKALNWSRSHPQLYYNSMIASYNPSGVDVWIYCDTAR
jgi:hypothetical protein